MSAAVRVGCDYEGCMAFITIVDAHHEATMIRGRWHIVAATLTCPLPRTWRVDGRRVLCGAHA